MQYRFGDIVLVDFPFSDGSATKRRPALVISHDAEDDILLARITSKPKESTFDTQLTSWKESKLLFPSTIRIGKLATLSENLVNSKIGELSKKDQTGVIEAFERLIALMKGS